MVPPTRRRTEAEQRSARMSLSGPTRTTRGGPERRVSSVTQAETKRMSVARNSLSRLSISRPTQPRKDPRPLKDKQFQARCADKIYEFLTQNDYEHPLTGKTLVTPSSKDFQLIFRFLYSFLDKGHIGGKKFEDDVLAFLKGMRYPFAHEISRSQLYTVGSLHAWPALLGMLFWLVEVIESRQAGQSSPEETKEMIFFGYLSEAYKAFLAGELNYTALREDLALKFAEKNKVCEAACQALRSAVADLEEAIKREQEQPKLLERKLDEKRILEEDVGKLMTYNEHLRKKTGKFEESVARGLADLDKEEAIVAGLTERKETLEEKIRQQTISPEDVDRMRAEKEILEKKLAGMSELLEELRRGCREKEAIQTHLAREIEDKANEYILAEKRCGIGLDHFDQEDFSLLLERSTEGELILGTDLRQTVIPVVSSLRETLGTETNELLKRRFELAESLENLSERLGDKEDATRESQARIERTAATYATEKTQFTTETSSSADKIEELDLSIQKIKSEVMAGTIEKKQLLQKLCIEKDSSEATNRDEKEKASRLAFSLVSELIKLKGEIEATLSEMEKSFIDEYETYG